MAKPRLRPFDGTKDLTYKLFLFKDLCQVDGACALRVRKTLPMACSRLQFPLRMTYYSMVERPRPYSHLGREFPVGSNTRVPRFIQSLKTFQDTAMARSVIIFE